MAIGRWGMSAAVGRRNWGIVKKRSSNVPTSSVRNAAPSVMGVSSGACTDCARRHLRCHQRRASFPSLRRPARDDIASGEVAICRGDAMCRVLLVPLATLSLVFLVTGCEGGGAPAPGPLGPTEGLRAGFARGGLADSIAIDAIERLPLRAAVLVAPDGTAIAASNIDVADSPRFATGQWTAGDPWRNALSGGGPAAALTMPHLEAGAALQGQQPLPATVSTAHIALPAP